MLYVFHVEIVYFGCCDVDASAVLCVIASVTRRRDARYNTAALDPSARCWLHHVDFDL